MTTEKLETKKLDMTTEKNEKELSDYPEALKGKSCCYLLSLPTDLLTEVFALLNLFEVVQFRVVNRFFRDFIDQHELNVPLIATQLSNFPQLLNQLSLEFYGESDISRRHLLYHRKTGISDSKWQFLKKLIESHRNGFINGESMLYCLHVGDLTKILINLFGKRVKEGLISMSFAERILTSKIFIDETGVLIDDYVREAYNPLEWKKETKTDEQQKQNASPDRKSIPHFEYRSKVFVRRKKKEDSSSPVVPVHRPLFTIDNVFVKMCNLFRCGGAYGCKMPEEDAKKLVVEAFQEFFGTDCNDVEYTRNSHLPVLKPKARGNTDLFVGWTDSTFSQRKGCSYVPKRKEFQYYQSYMNQTWFFLDFTHSIILLFFSSDTD